ncbi:hypothetical protein [Gillisia sp. Hel_I_86]|uniref:hypothetical protein n=1 Tax=Gillisia sp. Hel_I_86 TaxID=1249981 RepID=UPI0011A23067|nr:hypothetical protein [Gillisia sp. Hel_I_86]
MRNSYTYFLNIFSRVFAYISTNAPYYFFMDRDVSWELIPYPDVNSSYNPVIRDTDFIQTKNSGKNIVF